MTFGLEFVGQDATLNTGGKTTKSHDTSKNIRKLCPILRISPQEISWNIIIAGEHGYKSKHGCDSRPASDWVFNAVFESGHKALHDILIRLGCFGIFLSLLNFNPLVSSALIFVPLKSSSYGFFDEKQCKSSNDNTKGAHRFQSSSPPLSSDNHDTHTAKACSQIGTSSNNRISGSDFT